MIIQLIYPIAHVFMCVNFSNQTVKQSLQRQFRAKAYVYTLSLGSNLIRRSPNCKITRLL